MRTILVSLLFTINCLFAQAKEAPNEQSFRLDSTEGLELVNVKAKIVEHNGKTGVQVSRIEGKFSGETLVIIPEINFEEGVITVELTGQFTSSI